MTTRSHDAGGRRPPPSPAKFRGELDAEARELVAARRTAAGVARYAGRLAADRRLAFSAHHKGADRDGPSGGLGTRPATRQGVLISAPPWWMLGRGGGLSARSAVR